MKKTLKNLIKNKKGSGLVEKIMVTAFAVAAGGAVIAFTSNVIIESKNKDIAGLNLTDAAPRETPNGHIWKPGAYGIGFSENAWGEGWNMLYIDNNGILYLIDDESSVIDVYKNPYYWETRWGWTFADDCSYIDCSGFYGGDHDDGKLYDYGTSAITLPSGVTYSSPETLLDSFKAFYPTYQPSDTGAALSYGLYVDDGEWLGY